MEVNEIHDLLLSSFDDVSTIGRSHLDLLQHYHENQDSLIRSAVATLLVHFNDEIAQSMLMKLSKDKHSLVRTEAYDSLAVYPTEEVENLLQEAIDHEKNTLARSYAILSWIDGVLAGDRLTDRHIKFAQQKFLTERSPRCRLSWCYAHYRIGNRSSLTEILSYLGHDNYRMRCSALATADELLDSENKDEIKQAIERLLTVEKTIAVRSRAEQIRASFEN